MTPEHRAESAASTGSNLSNSNNSPAQDAVGRGEDTNGSGSNQSFRRQRAARACEVRCDAASLGVPCTNCVAFSIDCKIPTPKRKKLTGGRRDEHEYVVGTSPSPVDGNPMNFNRTPQTIVAPHQDGTPPVTYPDAKFAQVATDSGTYTQFMRPKFARAPIKEAGRVAYLGESSNLSLLVQDKHGSTDVLHYPLPENIRGTRARLTELDTIEIDILHQRGAFLLPPRALCDELVAAYFRWVAPIVPIINRSRFMRRYRDPKNPPSLLLLQSVLLAGSRVCDNPQLKDPSGSTTPAAMTFYKRAKALYDANYEDDRVTIVQSLVLMGWYWEGPEDVTKNVFYWSRVATIVAQGSGMHRSVEHSQLSQADKRLWKRIWWTLFTRDRSVAVALGRPVHINTDDSDVEMVTDDDFLDDEPGFPAEYPPDPLHVQFFLHHVKLCEIMGLVLAQQYSVASKQRRNNQIDLQHSDLALADWMVHVPSEMRYHVEDKSRQNFWAALLHSTYYTTLCLLHRAHMPPAMSTAESSTPMDEGNYTSRNIAFRAAHGITSIVDNLAQHDELKYCPAFIVYSLFSALIMHVYQMRSTNSQVVMETRERMKKCMDALREVSRVWIVAKMVFTLFESILGNKALEDRLHKSSGRRHHSRRHTGGNSNSNNHPNGNNTTHVQNTEPIKRKFDEMDLGPMSSGPAPTMSYERSRPQTPATTPGPNTLSTSDIPSMPAPGSTTPSQHIRDTFMTGGGGGMPSRTTTRPPTPFNPSLSVPATPPDLYLVTRSSPPISQSLWENFQPNQLFPDDSGMQDPQLGFTQWPTMHQEDMPGMTQGSSPDDTWSNSSKGGVVPATLNVEDWYVPSSSSPSPCCANADGDRFNFFGLNGELGPGS
ncbi:fungal-specific transcription factor domain-containing protein [Trichophaea hybrida]|nr:fungal-specific transcription factor domain-containing protein [Trichophaea hybrida]